jgi:hypothetical protein
MRYHITLKSSNSKVGPIPVTTTSARTCPPVCPLIGKCYASGGPLAIHWRKLTSGERGTNLSQLCSTISSLPDGQIWRHNQAGDLPGAGNRIDTKALRRLVKANRGKKGFTYTHKPMNSAKHRRAIQSANRKGFTINLSANNLVHADTLAELGIAPVVTILPANASGPITTPGGRKVVVCPVVQGKAQSCATCQLCQKQRSVIVGFPAHGTYTKLADTIAKG